MSVNVRASPRQERDEPAQHRDDAVRRCSACCCAVGSTCEADQVLPVVGAVLDQVDQQPEQVTERLRVWRLLLRTCMHYPC